MSTDARGAVISQRAAARRAGRNAPHTIEPRNAYMMNSLLHSVATAGTGAGTNVLKRNDLQGKTGTTNDAKDGWFAGYQHSLVAVAWMGYDQPNSLGGKEFGRQARACRSGSTTWGARCAACRNSRCRCADGITTLDGELSSTT